MAHIIRKKCHPVTLEPTINALSLETIGDQWIQRFMGRRPELATVRLRSMDMGRVKDTSHERLSKWFADLKSVIDEFNISIENIYNMDESGFAIGTIERSVTIINSEIRTRLQRANPGRQAWVTSVECICADGKALPPLIIFKAENLSHDWILADTSQDWAFSCNSKGWTNNQHGLEWLQRCFDPATRAKAGNQFRMLICDGHDSHVSGNFVEHCMNNRIHLMILPHHSSHLTQPLDVGVFGPLKRILASKLEPLLRTGVVRIQKPEFTSRFIKARELAFRESNILGGFRGTGIHPYYPPKGLRQVHEILPSSASTMSISASPGNPFNEAVMSSSPSNIEAVRAANTFLTRQIESGEVLTSRVRKYIPYLVRASEHTWTQKIILEQQNTEMKAVIEPRKRVLSGKRKVINGDSLITTVKHLRGIKAAEKATRKREPKKRKVGRGQAVKAQSVSSDEFECSSDSGSEDVVEIGDCIVVRR
jgi:DDE superfamily endonuclease